MYKKMPEYYEPIEVLDKDIEHCIEMDREEKAVLCGLLREWKPHKIVEIGLAAGGLSDYEMHGNAGVRRFYINEYRFSVFRYRT